ncbi:dipeptidase PepE [Actinocrinis puniceicyclus]|uniref:Dipeptidase PepE n=1 Tax=Actinocrinis puniceicyclus TaxID=977794 RepID=A0A8J8BDU4_9ACTN|nr:dipeptidase PepE [Actinocrinis puniceicyclus]MBS2966607.1 dipeptidase PepE [Actinocrinis puniceicyclus]
MNDLMLMSNSFSPGRGALDHAMDALAELFADCRHVLFVPYAGSNPDLYTEAMREILARLGKRLTGAHRAPDPLAALAEADAVFVGGGNAFRLLRAVQRNGLLPAIRRRVRAGMPYLGVSAGANLACPTIRTTNDMPIVQPTTLHALDLIPFQINPHYPDARRDGPSAVATRDQRLSQFLEENDVPVLGLCEGTWLHVRDATRAHLRGTTGARLLTRGREPRDLRPGDDLTDLLHTRPRYDTPITRAATPSPAG